MTEKEWLISQIFNIYDLLENKKNQPLINKARGLLNELKELI